VFDDLSDMPVEKVSLAWIDTQGFEAFVLAGATRLLDLRIPLFLEFWPYMLRKNSSLETLINLLNENYQQFVNVSNRKREAQPLQELHDLAKGLHGEGEHVDILVF
jgi:hypothetical protein